MQDDVLLSQFTPKEAIKFSANLHLNISEKEKNEKVDQLIRSLGLERC
jgi:ABC-type multidrug transport system ATPase subunit